MIAFVDDLFGPGAGSGHPLPSRRHQERLAVRSGHGHIGGTAREMKAARATANKPVAPARAATRGDHKARELSQEASKVKGCMVGEAPFLAKLGGVHLELQGELMPRQKQLHIAVSD